MIKQEMLADLRTMLEGWGIAADDWYVTGEASMRLSGYPVDYREGNMDILVSRDKWPWPRPEEIGNLMPDEGTEADDEFKAFIEKHKMMPDIHPLPHVGLKAEDRFEHSYWLPDETGVRVSTPWAQAMHRKIIIEFYESSPDHNLDVFDQAKFIRWKKFIQDIHDHAESTVDQKTVDVCKEVFPAVDRAIAYFDGDVVEDAGENALRGITAQPGCVFGAAAHWEDGKDFTGKIAILTHTLPAQVTALRNAAGIVTDQGGTLSHAAIIAREYGIPTVIGTKLATTMFGEGCELELNATEGVVRLV